MKGGVQLEELPEKYEGPYRKLISFLARGLPGGLALFALVTCWEATTGTLADRAGRAWLESIGRLPSAIGGQGNLSARSVLSIARARLEQDPPVRAVLLGDSVFSPDLGGGAANELPVDSTVMSYIPQSLNLSQEGGEWGMLSLLIQRVAREPRIQQLKPLLMLDVNFKFYGTDNSFSPAFPIEMELCAERDHDDPYADYVCASLARDWPPALRALSRWSPFLASGVLGQFDFFLTFVQRAPLYEFNVRGWGDHPFRTFLPGVADATIMNDSIRRENRGAWVTHYEPSGASTNNYIGGIYDNGYVNANNPKHQWLRALARAANLWPGPVQVYWIRPSPNVQAVLTPANREKIDRMGIEVASVFKLDSKKDLEVIQMHSILNEGDDYVDADHLTAKGHRKLGESVAARLGIPGGVK